MKAVKIFLIGILAIALSVTTGFGGEKKKVAVLFPGVVSDQSWNQFGYEGLKRAEKECGVEIAYSERVSQDTQLEVFRNYAAQGYDMIIGMGGEYTDAAIRASEEFPKVQFGLSNGMVARPNLTSFKVSYSQMGYLEGALGALMSKTGKIAMVSAQPLPIVKDGEESFRRGAEEMRPDVEVIFVATGSWDDVTKAREAGLALISRGVDVLAHHLDTADAGLISAAEDKGVYAIGLYRDSSSLGPRAVIGSSIGSPATLVYEMACGNAPRGKATAMTVNTPNGVDMHMTKLVPGDVEKRINEIIKKMRSGELYVKP